MSHTAYETVIGLEVHIQLLTRSKLFCADATQFGAAPNTQVSPVSLAHPGTLPVLNARAVDFALQLGLALQCHITRHSHFDRKHYFYPDLPKGFQTSQLTHPICVGGQLQVYTPAGSRPIAIHHIHLEEDAGKSLHDEHPTQSSIDLNRAGMPLLELVTEPDMRSADEAFSFVTELRRLVRWLGICDGNMEEGSLRVDANISIRPVGQQQLGTKVEVKNLNSIRNLRRAIEGEVTRQIALVESGQRIVQETRGYHADNNTTAPQREKEEANDYRYFPCPDLPPFTITDTHLQQVAEQLPELPRQLEQRLQAQWQLPAQDAAVLAEERPYAQYYLQLLQLGAEAKPAANWMLGPVRSYMNEHTPEATTPPLPPQQLVHLMQLVKEGTLNFSMAATRLLPHLMASPQADVGQLASQLGIVQEKNTDELEAWVDAVLAALPDKVAEYRKGKKGLMGLFVGEVKKRSKGKADPQLVMALLEKKLAS